MSTYSSDPALDYDLSVDGGIDVATCCFGTDVRLIVRGGCGRLQPEEAQAVGEALIRAAGDCRANAAWARGDQDEPHPNEIPLAAAEASCGGCGCADRLRADDVVEGAARQHAGLNPGEPWPSNEALGGNLTGTRDDEYRDAMRDEAKGMLSFAIAVLTENHWHGGPDPCVPCSLDAAPVSEHESRTIPDGFVEAFQKVSDETRNFLDQEATDG